MEDVRLALGGMAHTRESLALTRQKSDKRERGDNRHDCGCLGRDWALRPGYVWDDKGDDFSLEGSAVTLLVAIVALVARSWEHGR